VVSEHRGLRREGIVFVPDVVVGNIRIMKDNDNVRVLCAFGGREPGLNTRPRTSNCAQHESHNDPGEMNSISAGLLEGNRRNTGYDIS